MRKSLRRAVLVLAGCMAATMMTTSVFAQEWPLVAGDYWSVTGVEIKDGGGLKYANWLADEWKKNSEFAKSKGWLKDYRIFDNVHARAGEPNLYLVRIFEDMPSGPEGEKRYAEYMEWAAKSETQMETESGNRAEYRTVLSTMLLQEATFRE